MNTHDKFLKEEFQIERIAFFSDAVFAIAITILIVEIKVPEIHNNSSEPPDLQLINSLLNETLQKFIGFINSFFVIGLYWMVHHRLFNHIIHYNRKLMAINLGFLLSIVIMPFSTAFLSDYFLIRAHTPLAFYTLNICFVGYMSYRLWKLVSNPKNHLSHGLENKILLHYNTIRAFLIPSVFVLIFGISFLSPLVAYLSLPLLPFVSFFINRHYKKKYPELMKEHLSES
ncbi:MAG: DUF1211 domain-containing protein [Bacteroidetes bacterium]|nr:DUF1211 domain-containing protein [Bacteroidota bacterium]